MKIQILLALAILAFIGNAEGFKRSASIAGTCTKVSKNGRWRKDCNWCYCAEGGKPFCELKGCLPGWLEGFAGVPECEGEIEWQNDDSESCSCQNGVITCIGQRGGKSLGAQCQPGTVWQQDCNTCRCTETGIGVCTLRACLPKGRSDHCQPGETWQQDCNNCRCTSNGVGVCTRRACLPRAGKSLTAPKEVERPKDCTYMEGKHRWSKNCNWCSCTESGIGMCTLRGCLQQVSGLPECEGAAEWRVDSKWCKCVDGTASCQPIENEPSTTSNTLPDNVECAAGSSWTESCQDCKCTDGKKSCTRKLCRPSTVNLPTKCTAGSLWKKDCNICSCSDSGLGMCTQEICPSALVRSAALVKSAEESKSFVKDCKYTEEPARWRKNCNWCSCAPTGIGRCQLLGCLTEVPESEPQCEGPAEWRDGNKWCTCVAERAVCTEVGTRMAKALLTTSVVKNVRKDCKYTGRDSRWRKQCNWCSCTKNGIGMCTVMGCLPGYQSNEAECEGEAEWKKEDQWCRCVGGKASCTPFSSYRDNENYSLKGKQCAPTSPEAEFRIECNWCNCLENGLAVCTKKLCRRSSESDEPECKADAQWKKGEMWCTCSNGYGVCTEIINSAATDTIPSSAQTDPLDGKECVALSTGAEFRKECNWCHCLDAGYSVCTRIGCKYHRDTDEPECNGKIKWKRGDSLCSCSNGKAVCERQYGKPVINTRNKLKSEDLSGKECVSTSPEAEFRRECNWCNCLGSGLAVCTKKLCRGRFEEDEEEPECRADARWKKGSQWCSCENERARCDDDDSAITEEPTTEKPTTENPNPSPISCIPGDSWKDKCNTCYCTEVGIAICTKIACVEADGTTQNTGDRQIECIWAQRENRFRRECNWCRCSRSGKGYCTRKVCRPGREDSSGKECERNAVWMRDGVWCRCVNGQGLCGSHVNPFEMNELVVKSTQCTEGSRWRIACNWCECRNGLKMCTESTCIPGTERSLDGFEECEGTSEWRNGIQACKCLNGRAHCLNEKVSKLALKQRTANQQSCKYTSDRDAWKVNCNWCNCMPTNVAACTIKGCLTKEITENIQCEGTAKWMKDECNWCDCVSGVGSCSSYNCTLLAEVKTLPAKTECMSDTPEARWRDVCNWCSCRLGKSLCTRKKCSPAIRIQEEHKCEGNIQWRSECNWCYCKSGKAVCTKNQCSLDGRSTSCTEGSTWIERCNTCLCSGGEAYCTSQNCDAGTSLELSRIAENMLITYVDDVITLGTLARAEESPLCTEGSNWMDKCNWCTCENGLQKCNNDPCPEDYVAVNPVCTDDSKWTENCNLCTCVEGVAVCSTASCVAITTRQLPSPDKKCKEGSQWKKHCNWCHCIGGEPFCGQNICTGPEPTTGIQCTDNAEWRQDSCTWCTCQNKIGNCITSQSCGSQAQSDEPTCSLGKRVRRGCNTCVCPDGIIEICTQIECDAISGDASISPSDSPPQDPNNRPSADEPHICDEGAVWTEQEESCACVSNIIICSRSNLPHIQGKSSSCKDNNLSWKEECNTCQCIDGLAACTRRACKSHQRKSALPEFCSLKPVRDQNFKCLGFAARWTHDMETETCTQFIYGGCGATENNFETEADCLKQCHVPDPKQKS